MTEPAITLGKVLDRISPGAVQDGLQRHLKEQNAHATVLALVSGFVSEQAAHAVEEELLKVDLFSALARAWATAAELHKYADATKYPADAPQKVVLTKKSVSAPQDVELRLELEGLPIVPLVLTVDLKAVFDCVTLTVGGGRVMGVDLGSASVSAGLMYRDVVLVAPRRSDTVALGARLNLGDGILIR
jgi:hypothetical protein